MEPRALAKETVAPVNFVGGRSHEASQEELARLLQQRGLSRVQTRPVTGAGSGELDFRRVKDYFTRIRQQASIDAVSYASTEPDCSARARLARRGPLVPFRVFRVFAVQFGHVNNAGKAVVQLRSQSAQSRQA